MGKTWSKPEQWLRPGLKIVGKWHQNEYVLKRKLGQGAIGTVYLCEMNGQLVALKMSEKNTSMTMEVNVLKSLEKARDHCLGPSLLDVDDWQPPHGPVLSFYVMEYIQGEPLRTFLQRNGTDWLGVFMLQLLDDLDKLHEAGWVCGDLKLENLLVTNTPPRIRWIDVGGTTKIGRAIKEYTEFYDRGYWGMGSRKAEPSYDLFAFAMVCIGLFYASTFERGKQQPEVLIRRRLHRVQTLRPFEACIMKAITGKYRSAKQMHQDISHVLQQMKAKKRDSSSSDAFLMEGAGMLLLAGGYYLLSLFIP
ncbi:protein kinase [Ornithinibacillus gellani]|nr:protein kinase [Ornithinibacillus gellani]